MIIIDNEINFSEMLFNRDERLLDYITNLQEENERLKEELQQEKKDFKEANDYCFELKDYKSRNEKAIKILESNYQDCCIVNKILKNKELTPDEEDTLDIILNGDDKNE